MKDNKKELDLEQMLNTCFEIEGLITLLRYRDVDTPEEINHLLREKIGFLAAEMGVGVAVDGGNDKESAEIAASVEFEEMEDADTAAPEEAPKDPEEDDDKKAESAEDKATLPATDEVEGEKSEAGSVAEKESETVETDVVEAGEDDQDLEEAEVVFEDDEPEAEENTVEAEVEEKTPKINSLFDGLDDDQPMTLDEKLARDGSVDIKRAFSLNDKFRFRRELFGNKEADFQDAMHMISAMNSYAEAADYFYNDLGWNSEVEDVKDFMEILKKHFSARR